MKFALNSLNIEVVWTCNNSYPISVFKVRILVYFVGQG